MSEFDLYDLNNELIISVLKTKNIEVYNIDNGQNRTLICFSGNGLFVKNDEVTFKKTIIDDNRYEWKNLCKHPKFETYYGQIIFVRDVFKQWYVNGINSECTSVDDLISLLKSIIPEKNIIVTVGNSAGGYMAMLVGIKLKAKSIFSFSGQFSIWDQVDKAPLLQKYKNDVTRNKYYDISQLLDEYDFYKENTKLYHFYPAKCDWDVFQVNHCPEKKNIHFFAFNRDTHGVTVSPHSFPYILTLSNKKMEKLCYKYENQLIDAENYLKNVIGWKYIIYFIKKQIDKVRMKIWFLTHSRTGE